MPYKTEARAIRMVVFGNRGSVVMSARNFLFAAFAAVAAHGSVDFSFTDSADQACEVFAIDVDGDGDVDVLSASHGDDTIAWYASFPLTPAPSVSSEPSLLPTPAPSPAPTTAAPSPPPTLAPSPAPTTPEPSPIPSPGPSSGPSPLPSPVPSPLPTTRIDDDDDDDAASVATILVVAAACAALVAVVAALAVVVAKRRRTPPLEPAVAHPTKEAPAGQMA